MLLHAAKAEVNFKFCSFVKDCEAVMARAVQKVALKCEQANENGVLGKFLLLKVSCHNIIS